MLVKTIKLYTQKQRQSNEDVKTKPSQLDNTTAQQEDSQKENLSKQDTQSSKTTDLLRATGQNQSKDSQSTEEVNKEVKTTLNK